MKKISLALVLCSMLFMTSCNTSSLLGGSWSFKNIGYTAFTCVGSTTLKTLTASTATTTDQDNVVCHFSSFPPAAGTYTITNVPVSSSDQVYVILNVGTKVYTIDNSASGSATVTVSGSKISVTIPPVNFSNSILQSSDNGSFTATLNQVF